MPPERGGTSPSARGQPRNLPPRAKEVAARLEAALARAQDTTAGRVQRRVLEMDLIHQAMVLAALAMMLLIPALITLAALVPLGDTNGGAQIVARRLGLSAQAARDLQSLFGGPQVVRGGTSWLGAAVTLLSAYAWPTALQKGYQIAWHLPSRGLHDLWRPLLWLAVLLGGFASLAALGGTRLAGPVLAPVVLAPVVVGWAWWTQHLLLGGRVGWRPLLGGAITIAAGLYALRALAALVLSSSITDNYRQYGPIGIVFMLLSWFIAFSVVMLGGAVVGEELWEARMRRANRGGAGPETRGDAMRRALEAARARGEGPP